MAPPSEQIFAQPHCLRDSLPVYLDGEVGSGGHELPARRHRTKTVARDYINRQLNQKLKQGLVFVRVELNLKLHSLMASDFSYRF